MTVAVLLLAALLVGCGDSRSPATKAMNAKFDMIDYELANLETVTSSYNIDYLTKATQKYIALVREYAHQLGRENARRRLKEEGDQVGPYCLPCEAMLTDAAMKY